MSNLPPLRPPPRPRSPSGARSQSSASQQSMRSESSLSTTSNDSSQVVPMPLSRRSPYQHKQSSDRPSTAGGSTASQSTSSLQTIQTLPRQAQRGSVDGSIRNLTPILPGQSAVQRARQHSQGFFEPSLPHATANPSGLTASQIAAQAAMHHVSPTPLPLSQERKKSYPFLAPINTSTPTILHRRPSDNQSPQYAPAGGYHSNNGSVAGNRLAATSAANAAFPHSRSPLPSPGLPPSLVGNTSMPPPPSPLPPLDKEPKVKSSKMKLFKPKNIILTKDKDAKAAPGAPSPGKMPSAANFLRGGFPNASTSSLVDPGSSSNSLYSSANASTSTLVPATTEKDKEKRHNFLSRQKNKLHNEPTSLSLSSAHSNSQATNPDKPQPLYSFVPDSPSTFQKSMSGFDIRHGGRALRERKKEEKAAAKLDMNSGSSITPSATQLEQLLGPSSLETIGGTPLGSASMYSYAAETPMPVSAQAFSNIGAQMGIPGIGPDDAWPLIKARLLNLFSGETLRTPVENLNALVSVHVRRCVQRRTPITLIDDVQELLSTGFSSLSQTLRGVPDDRLVTNLVEMWIGVYGAVLPFLQAVFLPLELEFRGRGNLMTARDAQEFWGALPESIKSDDRPPSAGGVLRVPNLADELEIRRLTLIAFRDTVILPRHESLLNIFSRLSLDNINAGPAADPNVKSREHARSDPATSGAERPDTAGSLSPRLSSFNSQGSTLLDAASQSSGGALSLASRSRATSNTSAGSFGTSMPHLNSPIAGSAPGAFSSTTQPYSPPVAFTDPAKVTETVGRMLQCLYVLASCHTGDVAQGNVERLTGALKYNWLGRGRTGRDRRGWVGMKAGQRVGLVKAG